MLTLNCTKVIGLEKIKSEPTTETTGTNENLDGLESDTALPQSSDVCEGSDNYIKDMTPILES